MYTVIVLGVYTIYTFLVVYFQTEIAKRLNAIIAQVLPFLAQEHQQQVATAVERAKQVTMTELNAIIGVGDVFFWFFWLVFIFVARLSKLQLSVVKREMRWYI